MVQTFKQSLQKSSSAADIQLMIDQFVFDYHLTPHSTTGVSPAELMFDHRLRSRLDLLWPGESVSAKVHERQQAQKRSHSKMPRNVQLSPNSAVMIRNYANRGPKWVPSVVTEKTGPLSYRCSVPSGVVKRHQDQIILRNSLPDTVPEVMVPVIPHSPKLTPIGVDAPASAPEAPCASQGSAPVETVPQLQGSPRRSSRARKPVDRLNL